MTFAKSSGRLHDPGQLSLRLTAVEIEGKMVPISTSAFRAKGKSHTKSNVTKIGGGTAAGRFSVAFRRWKRRADRRCSGWCGWNRCSSGYGQRRSGHSCRDRCDLHHDEGGVAEISQELRGDGLYRPAPARTWKSAA